MSRKMMKGLGYWIVAEKGRDQQLIFILPFASSAEIEAQ
jgi:hypothetical protein